MRTCRRHFHAIKRAVRSQMARLVDDDSMCIGTAAGCVPIVHESLLRNLASCPVKLREATDGCRPTVVVVSDVRVAGWASLAGSSYAADAL
jgi:hypothetical protein